MALVLHDLVVQLVDRDALALDGLQKRSAAVAQDAADPVLFVVQRGRCEDLAEIIVSDVRTCHAGVNQSDDLHDLEFRRELAASLPYGA